MSEKPRHKPTIVFHGPAATHDQACAILHHVPEPAVFDCNRGVFMPSWEAQSDGWRTVQVTNILQRFALWLLWGKP